MTTAALAVLTCDRPEPSLPHTLELLEQGGALELAEAAVFADGCDPIVPPGWTVQAFFPRAGIRAQLWRAFRFGLEAGVDRLIVAEDDITPVRNAVRYLARLEIPADVAFVDAHDMKERPVKARPGAELVTIDHAAARSTGGYWGNQLMVFPRRTLEYLAPLDPFAILSQYREADTTGRPAWVAGDVVLGELVGKSPWPRWAVHLPRLCRHDGHASAAHPTAGRLEGFRKTLDFPGESFDALSQLVVHS